MGGGKEIVPVPTTKSVSTSKSSKSQSSSNQAVGYEKTRESKAVASAKYVNRHGEKYVYTSKVKVVERTEVVRIGSSSSKEVKHSHSSSNSKVAHHHSSSKKH